MRIKLNYLFCLLGISLSMSSCFNDLNPETNPVIFLSAISVNPVYDGDSIVSTKDTLFYSTDPVSGITVSDTLLLGDTAVLGAICSGEFNSLVAVKANYDTTRVQLWFDLNEQISKALVDNSKPEKGEIYFKPGYSGVSFPIYIVPLEVGTMDLAFTVTSDSKYPTNSVMFRLPVKAKN